MDYLGCKIEKMSIFSTKTLGLLFPSVAKDVVTWLSVVVTNRI